MKYKHALFLNPYAIRKTKSASITRLFPPTGLEFVATSAKDYVEKLTLLDLRYEEELSDIDNLLEFINNKGIDVICVGIGWDREFKDVCALLSAMPVNIPLIIGGHKATEEADNLLELCPNIDILVRGEGEETIRDIMQGPPLKDILGISYRQGDKVLHNDNRPLPGIDIISSPDRSLRRNQYRLTVQGNNVTNLTYDTILSARGCPFNCKFCTFTMNPLGQKRPYAERDVDSVIEEIASIEADSILFSDENFATNAKRAEKICDLIIEKNIKKRFLAQVRIEIADHPQLLDKMVKAGFKMLSLGIESPHDHILKELNKGFDSKKIREAFKVFTKYPIFYHGYFIYGNIGETEEEMLYIGKFAREIGVDTIACSKLRISKFSPLKKFVDESPSHHLTEKGEIYSDAYSHSDLKRINKQTKRMFYTPGKVFQIAIKFIRTRWLTLKDIIPLISVAPALLKSTIASERHKARTRKR